MSPLVLEQVAHVLETAEPEPASAPPVAARQLVVDERGRSVGRHQPVRFLVRVVVRHAAAMDRAEQPACIRVEAGVGGSRLVQDQAVDEGPDQSAPASREEGGHAGLAGERRQRPDLTPGEDPRDRARPKGRRGVAPPDGRHGPAVRVLEDAGFDRAHQVALEKPLGAEA